MAEIKKTAPNSVAALVLGICSIVFGCFFVGLICGIIGLIMAKNGLNSYNSSPEEYDGNGMLKAGKITSIIGIVLGSLYIIYYIFAVLIIGSTALSFMEILG